MNKPNHNAPFGTLELSPDGLIVSAPEFFLNSLETQVGDPIFELFGIDRTPRLNFIRFESRSPSLIEYHVVVESLLCDPASFRYWFIRDTDSGNSIFGMIDDTAVHRYEEWRFHQLRALITQDVQEVVISEFRDKFTTLAVLADALKNPGNELQEIHKRLRKLAASLVNTIQSIDEDFRQDEQASEAQAPIAVHDLIRTIPSWSSGLSVIEVTVESKAASKIINDVFLKQALLPIVTNAVEASEESGNKVQVHIWLPENTPGYLVFDVIDEGCGMDIDTLARAEDPFFTTKEGHVGLGLSHVRQFMDNQNANFKLRTTETGSHVRLTVPIIE